MIKFLPNLSINQTMLFYISFMLWLPMVGFSQECESEYEVADRTGLPSTSNQYFFNINHLEREVVNGECITKVTKIRATCTEHEIINPNVGQKLLLKKYDELTVLQDLNTPYDIALAATRIAYIQENYIFAFDAAEVIHALTWVNRSPFIYETWAHTNLNTSIYGAYNTKQNIYIDVLTNVTVPNHELASKLNFYVPADGTRKQTLVEWENVVYDCDDLEVSLDDVTVCDEVTLTPHISKDISTVYDDRHVLTQCYGGYNPEYATTINGYYAQINQQNSYITLDLGKVYPANTPFLVRLTGNPGGTNYEVSGSTEPYSNWVRFGRNRTNSTTNLDVADNNFKSTASFRYVRVKNLTGGNIRYDGITIIDRDAPSSFLWSTGETTESIVVTDPGTYSVTVKTYVYSTQNNCYVVNCTKTASATVTEGTCLTPPVATNNYSLQNQPGPVTQQVITEDDGDGVDYATNALLVPNSFSHVNPFQVRPSNTDTDGDGVSDTEEGRTVFTNNINYLRPTAFTGTTENVTNINNAKDSSAESYSIFANDGTAYYVFNKNLETGTQIIFKVKNPSGQSENFTVQTGSSENDAESSSSPAYNTTDTGVWEYFTHIVKEGDAGSYIKISTDNTGEELFIADITVIETTISANDADADNDGLSDYLDIDSDGDNSPDTIDFARLDSSEVYTYNPITYIDTNQDGFIEKVVIEGEGTWELTGMGEVTFTPNQGFTNDPEPIFYTIKDDKGGITNNARIIVDYLPVTANDENLDNAIGTTVTIGAIQNDTEGDAVDTTTLDFDPQSVPNGQGFDTDNDGDIDKVIVPGEGVWTVDNAGIVTFSPEDDFINNPTPISYTILDDEDGRSNVSTITITYLLNNNTIANNDTNQTPQDVPVSGDIIWNDIDPQGDIQTVIGLLGDTNGDGINNEALIVGSITTIYGTNENGDTVEAGTIIINENGIYTFDPNASFTGTIAINYEINDDGLPIANDTAVLVIDVIGNNDEGLFPPIAKDDIYIMEPGQPITMPILTNDSDVDGNIVPTTVSLILNPNTNVLGILTDNEGNITKVIVDNEGIWLVDQVTGEVTFTPDSGFVGNPSPIDYSVADNDGFTDTATITITTGVADTNEMGASDDGNIGFAGDTLTDSSHSGNNILLNDIDADGSTGTVSITAAYVDSDGDGLYDDALTLGTAVVVFGRDVNNNVVEAGTVTVNADGTYTYVSNPTYVGTTLVPYTVCDHDTANACANATLELTTIKSPNYITGNVYNDTDGDGNGDENIADVLITLFNDVDGNGVYSSGDTEIASTTTNANGEYVFNDLNAGNYVVVETQPTDYYNQNDSDDIVDGPNDNDLNNNTLDNQLSVSLVPGEWDTGNNFVETQLDYMISGTIFYDEDELDNGIVDGIPFSPRPTTYAVLLDKNGVVVATDEVNDQFGNEPGQYLFTNIPAGNVYQVILRAIEPALGSVLTESNLPSYYYNVGENIGSGVGSDGTIDGKSVLFILNQDVTEVNFGIKYFKPGTFD